jgi:hypothetical protein
MGAGLSHIRLASDKYPKPKKRNFSLMTGSPACGSGLSSSNKLSLTHDQRIEPVTP